MKWAIFDMDDTLTGVFDEDGNVQLMGYAYTACKEEWYDAMYSWGFEDEDFIDLHTELDTALVKELGYGERSRFGESFVETYLQLAQRQGVAALPSAIRRCREIAEKVFQYEYAALPGALEVLYEIKPWYNIAVVTRGPEDVQRDKAVSAGITEWADHFRVVERKDLEEWRHVLAEMNLSPWGGHWAIGNSLVTDVARPLELGLNGILVNTYQAPIEEVMEEAPTPLPGREYHAVSDIREVTNHLLGV